ncbi:unnamed protein product [Kluyveromyces dobzhanskii CBS 2104]|uniref:Lysophospholipase n=1 Tax=Kluyveromyces dobzhanskii CBS 2104 TaxID=1427455 RepID=A0A0A8LAE9_9SACH|nr:unnamed protein product [Kluyveromyces dobzhanskii CBS 2104]
MRILLVSSLARVAFGLFYGLENVKCPKNAALRVSKEERLNELESAYLQRHAEVIHDKFEKFYEDIEIPGIDINDIEFPNISLAISGGGIRSMLTSSGFILGMHRYGLWECNSFVAGISGGSWTLLKLIMGEFNVDTLTKFDIERLMLEGIPDFDVKNHDMIRQNDFGNDAKNEAKLFAMDEEFLKELRQQSIDLSKRDVDVPIEYEPSYYHFLDEVSDVMECESEVPGESAVFKKRSLDSLYKIKGVVEDFFHQEETDQNKELAILNNLMDSFSKLRKTIGFYINLHRQVRQKKEAGFPISLTDYLGQALLDRLPVRTNEKLKQLSNLKHSKCFEKFEAPIPLIIANAKTAKGPELHNVIFEFTPFEFGSWHINISKFLPTEYLGSTVSNGKLESCVVGFDNLGFIAATSSSLFNNALLYIWKTVTTNIESNDKLKAIKTIFGVFGVGLNALRSDYAIYQPNPFYKDADVLSSISDASQLFLVDGGEDGENIPIRPLLIDGRQNDVIFLVDSSSDKENLPNMTKLQNTYANVVELEKQKKLVNYKHELWEMDLMPYIPTSKELVHANHSLSHPIAFGCHVSSYHPKKMAEPLASQEVSASNVPPILIYHGNHPITFQSNTSTFRLNYTRDEYSGMLNNGHHLFDNNDATGEYLQCLGCVMLLRRNPDLVSSFCDECVTKGLSWEEWHMKDEHGIAEYTPEQFFDLHDLGGKGYFDATDIITMYGLHRDFTVGKGDGMGQNDESQKIDKELRDRAVKVVMALLDVDDDTRITRKEYLSFASNGNKFADLGVGVGHHGDFETEYETHHWNKYHKDQDPDIKNVHKEDVEHELLHHEHEVESVEDGPVGAAKGAVITDDEMESRIEQGRIPKKYRAN